jgi:hypothetical protein
VRLRVFAGCRAGDHVSRGSGEGSQVIGEVVSGVLVDLVVLTGRRLGTSAAALRGRRRRRDLDLARWLDTYQIAEPPSGICELPAGASMGVTEAEIADVLRGAEVHGVLHELLAARLTGAAEADVAHVRAAFTLTISATIPSPFAGSLAGGLFGYYDREISQLVMRLRATRPDLLGDVRADAFGARMIAIMQAIERHVEALSARPGPQAEADFLARYRRHVTEHHGMLEPPDFERRRRVPVDDLYVSPGIVQLQLVPAQVPAPPATLRQFAQEIDRTVLLGAPGTGKTTAANVLIYWQASQRDGRVPFLVTLREFTSAHGSGRSVTGYLRERLEGFYQCPAPEGTIERLLLSGRALVIFDGLDELTDATHRGEVTSIIERFCTEYPLAHVLVTSRLAGYEQARLDDRQFTRYRIGGFDDRQVTEYVQKWFAQEDGLSAAGRQAIAFLAESASVPDLRANPLMLALMCVLYRGEGSIPRNRPGVYEKCSMLLLGKWDARRHIHVQLRAGAQAEPATRHLAYWILTSHKDQPVVTERELLRETSAFLADRSFEDPGQAAQAAEEFIAFCQDRAWVFSDAGTTATGERLYTFTHQTFLEYFAAAHLAAIYDTPEQFAAALVPRIARQEWEVVAELAIQIKCASCDRGDERAYLAMLRDSTRQSVKSRSNILLFLARCTQFLEPPPRTIRVLARAILDHFFSGDANDPDRYQPLSWLLASCVCSRDTVRDQVSACTSEMIGSTNPAVRLNGLRLAVWVSRGAMHVAPDGYDIALVQAPEEHGKYWDAFAYENAQRYRPQIIEASSFDEGMLFAALRLRFRTAADVLDTPGTDLTQLLQAHQSSMFGAIWYPYLVGIVTAAMRGWKPVLRCGLPWMSLQTLDEDFAALGRYFLGQPEPAWATICLGTRYEPVGLFNEDYADPPGMYQTSDPVAYLGGAAALLLTAEATRDRTLPTKSDNCLGSFSDLYPYILRRWDADPAADLPDLPVPGYFQRLFRAWANKDVDLIRRTDRPHP